MSPESIFYCSTLFIRYKGLVGLILIVIIEKLNHLASITASYVNKKAAFNTKPLYKIRNKEVY